MGDDGKKKVRVRSLSVHTVVHVEVGKHRAGNEYLRICVTPPHRNQGIYAFFVRRAHLDGVRRFGVHSDRYGHLRILVERKTAAAAHEPHYGNTKSACDPSS